MTPRNLHVPTAVLVAMLAAGIVNVVQFPMLELATSDWYQAIRIKPGHDVSALVSGHFASTQERFSLYADLRELAPGATVVVERGGSTLEAHMRGLGAAAAVERPGSRLEIDAAAAQALERHAVATGEDVHLGRYVIALPDGPVDQLVVVQAPDATWIVERSLLDDVAPGVAP